MKEEDKTILWDASYDDYVAKRDVKKKEIPKGYHKIKIDDECRRYYCALFELKEGNPELFNKYLILLRSKPAIEYIATAINFGYPDLAKVNFRYLGKKLKRRDTTIKRVMIKGIKDLIRKHEKD